MGARRILIADDSPTVLSSLSKAISSAGHQVTTVENGAAVVEQLKTTKYDLVLLDLEMPVMNGFDVLEELQKMHLQDMPVIASTAEQNSTQDAEIIALGAAAICSKPLQAEKLMALVKQLIH